MLSDHLNNPGRIFFSVDGTTRVSHDYPATCIYSMVPTDKPTHRFKAPLGVGSIGRVYLMEPIDNTTHKPIAIKEFYPTAHSNWSKEEIEQHFTKQQQAAQQEAQFNLNINGIGAYYCSNDPLTFAPYSPSFTRDAKKNKNQKVINDVETYPISSIAMEYFEDSCTLQDYVENNKFVDATQYIKICIALLQAVKRFHEKGLIHRDINGVNVLVHEEKSGNYVIQLIDYSAGLTTPIGQVIRQEDLAKCKAPECKSGESTIAHESMDFHGVAKTLVEYIPQHVISAKFVSVLQSLFKKMSLDKPAERVNTDFVITELEKLILQAQDDLLYLDEETTLLKKELLWKLRIQLSNYENTIHGNQLALSKLRNKPAQYEEKVQLIQRKWDRVFFCLYLTQLLEAEGLTKKNTLLLQAELSKLADEQEKFPLNGVKLLVKQITTTKKLFQSLQDLQQFDRIFLIKAIHQFDPIYFGRMIRASDDIDTLTNCIHANHHKELISILFDSKRKHHEDQLETTYPAHHIQKWDRYNSHHTQINQKIHYSISHSFEILKTISNANPAEIQDEKKSNSCFPGQMLGLIATLKKLQTKNRYVYLLHRVGLASLLETIKTEKDLLQIIEIIDFKSAIDLIELLGKSFLLKFKNFTFTHLANFIKYVELFGTTKSGVELVPTLYKNFAEQLVMTRKKNKNTKNDYSALQKAIKDSDALRSQVSDEQYGKILMGFNQVYQDMRSGDAREYFTIFGKASKHEKLVSSRKLSSSFQSHQVTPKLFDDKALKNGSLGMIGQRLKRLIPASESEQTSQPLKRQRIR